VGLSECSEAHAPESLGKPGYNNKQPDSWRSAGRISGGTTSTVSHSFILFFDSFANLENPEFIPSP
jgi:hypothetical protein